MNRASDFEWHKIFKEGRESARDDETCGRSKEVNRPQLIGKGLGLGLVCWGFKWVQEEIPLEEASTVQIVSVAFPPGQCTSPQLHHCPDYLTKMGNKTVPHPPYSPDLAPCDFWLFPKLTGCRYETRDERGCDEGHWHAHTRGLPWAL